MSRLHRSVSVRAPIRISTEKLERGDLVERICETVDGLVEGLPHVAWVDVRERARQDDGSSEVRIVVHRCCASPMETPEHTYRVRKVESGRYRLDPK